MDKQEYREIVGDIRRAYDRKEYDKVLMYAEELDMRRVSDSRVLEMISDSHMAMGDLATARELLLKAYEKTPMGRKIAYKLSELSIKLGDLDGAVDFYEDFCKMAPHDNDRFLLKYKIGKAGMHAVPSEHVNAPVIEEFKLILECRVVDMKELGSHVQVNGEIVNVLADEEILDENGGVDIAKLDPILVDPSADTYHRVGECVGKIFHDGLKLK